jgi:hypothetical protein
MMKTVVHLLAGQWAYLVSFSNLAPGKKGRKRKKSERKKSGSDRSIRIQQQTMTQRSHDGVTAVVTEQSDNRGVTMATSNSNNSEKLQRLEQNDKKTTTDPPSPMMAIVGRRQMLLFIDLGLDLRSQQSQTSQYIVVSGSFLSRQLQWCTSVYRRQSNNYKVSKCCS